MNKDKDSFEGKLKDIILEHLGEGVIGFKIEQKTPDDSLIIELRYNQTYRERKIKD